jgi:hypothetical protein
MFGLPRMLPSSRSTSGASGATAAVPRPLRRALRVLTAITALVILTALALTAPRTPAPNSGGSRALAVAGSCNPDTGVGCDHHDNDNGNPPPSNCPYKMPNLTGVWAGDDRALYFLRQIGTTVWWAGMSVENWDAIPVGSRDFQLGLNFTSVFQGSLSENASLTAPWRLAGNWIYVPRGASVGHGTLSFLLVCRQPFLAPQLQIEYATVGFGATTLTGPLHPGFPYSQQQADCNVRCRFHRVGRNDYKTMEDHLTLYKDYFTLYGYLRPGGDGYGEWVNWPTRYVAPLDFSRHELDRSFGHFYCAKVNHGDIPTDASFNDWWWDSGDDPPDGDVNLAISEIPYLQNYLLAPGPAEPPSGDWHLPELGSGNWPEDLSQGGLPSLDTFDAELIMYGSPGYLNRNDCNPPDRVALLPGWADSGANSVLVNGQPINGATDQGMEIVGGGYKVTPRCQPEYFTGDTGERTGWCLPQRIGPWRPASGQLPSKPSSLPCPAWLPQEKCPDGIEAPQTLLRITGALVRDCHGTSCDGPWEIHPVYSVDRINPASSSFEGVWAANDYGTYYVREFTDKIGRKEIWWLGLSQDQGQTFANVFHGTRPTSSPTAPVVGTWVDVPLGAARWSGALSLSVQSPCQGAPFHYLRVSVCASVDNPQAIRGFYATRFAKLYGGQFVNPSPTG